TCQAIRDVRGQGRFFPVAYLLTYYEFFFVSGLLWYKGLILAWVAGNIWLFHRVLNRLTGDRALATASSLFTVILFQLRVYHDPFLSYNGLVQIVFALVLLSSIFLYRYLETAHRFWLCLSVGAYGLSLLTYEMAYAFFFFPLLILFRERKTVREALKPF